MIEEERMTNNRLRPGEKGLRGKKITLKAEV